MSRPITLLDVKQALRDKRFRDGLPEGFKEDIQKYLNNPGCACNMPIYKRVITEAKAQVAAYFPNRPISNIEDEVKKLADNNWTVINCHKDELQERLRKLPSGRKQIAVTRYEDQVTVVVNELDIIY
jgi:hypothetical protein